VVSLHDFPAVTCDDETELVIIVEAFDRTVSKWTAIDWFARQRSIPHDRIATIGDQINDLPMIRNAGIGIAMGNAVATIHEVATHRTRDNLNHGVAYAIDRILDGTWGKRRSST
jgi:hypothetical protein